jgi:hypothetical protein
MGPCGSLTPSLAARAVVRRYLGDPEKIFYFVCHSIC